MMRILLVNSQHIDTPHIGAVRTAFFARELARRGHQVTVLTPSLTVADAPIPLERIESLVAGHDWSSPLSLTHPVAPVDRRETASTGAIGRLARRAKTVSSIVFGDGTGAARIRPSRAYWIPIVDHVRPQVIWSTFGDTSNLVVAQSIGRLAGVPWVMDIKDNWEEFLPHGLRQVAAWRFRDATSIMSNARVQADVAERWHRRRPVVVYSGIAAEMIAPPHIKPDPMVFRITLIGSTRESPNLALFLTAVKKWLGTLKDEESARIELCYAGSSSTEVAAAATAAGLSKVVRIEQYLSFGELASLCQSAAVNCYLWATYGFHHKLLELLACRRPVISFPGEHAESIDLARRVGGALSPCADEAQVAAALDHAWRGWNGEQRESTTVDVSEFSWPALAAQLETVMRDAISSRS